MHVCHMIRRYSGPLFLHFGIMIVFKKTGQQEFVALCLSNMIHGRFDPTIFLLSAENVWNRYWQWNLDGMHYSLTIKTFSSFHFSTGATSTNFVVKRDLQNFGSTCGSLQKSFWWHDKKNTQPHLNLVLFIFVCLLLCILRISGFSSISFLQNPEIFKIQNNKQTKMNKMKKIQNKIEKIQNMFVVVLYFANFWIFSIFENFSFWLGFVLSCQQVWLTTISTP